MTELLDNWILLGAALALVTSAAGLAGLALLRHRRGRAPRPQAPAAPRPAGPDPSLVLSRRIAELEAQLSLLAERQDQLDLRRRGQRPFQFAIKLARRGAPVDEIMSTCGLSRGEAELIALMHQHPH